MSKYSALITAMIGAALLVLQQAVTQKNWDLKVVGLTLLVAVVGAASTVLKGKGASLVGVVGTVGYTAVTIYNTGYFTWGEFVLTAALNITLLFAPSIMPQKEEKKE